MLISKEQLVQIMPKITPENLEKFFEPINSAMAKWEINTPRRITMFLAQVAHESGSFRYVREIASGEAYEGRKDLGNTEPGDGVRFKGRGLIQITGRKNYELASVACGVDLIGNPELLEGPVHAANSAGWFWKMRGLNEIADQPDTWSKEWRGLTYSPFDWVTIRINGGLNGLQDRLKYYANAKKALGL